MWTGPAMSSASLAAAHALPVRGWSIIVKGQSKLLKCLYCLLAIFNKSLPHPLAFRVQKRPTIPVRCARAALKGLLHSAGCTTAHLYRHEKMSALYSIGEPPPACDTCNPSTFSCIIATQAAIPHPAHAEGLLQLGECFH